MFGRSEGKIACSSKLDHAISPFDLDIIESWNHDVDHVHVMFRAEPKSELSKFLNAYKSASSRLVKKEFPEIRESLWKEMFWSKSFCLLTTGGATMETIQRYIETQGEKKHKED